MTRDKPESRAARDSEFVRGLAHGLRVLEAFEARSAELSLSEVARHTGLTPATARRSLHTLTSLGYVRRAEKQFVLSARILALGSSYLRLTGIEETLLPHLRAIVSRCGDTAGIAILIDTEILYIAHYSEQRGVRAVASTGVRYPAHATSLGRVLLSGLTRGGLDDYFRAARIERHTELTEIDPRKLRAIVGDARRSGYATIVDELFYGVTSLSVPIIMPGGRVIAALNTSGYSGQITPADMIKQRLPELRASAIRIAETMARSSVLLHSLQLNG
jgi:IclR family pca regulon transcriptional regulator